MNGSGVQSLDRTFVILESIADAGGVAGLSRLHDDTGLPLATIHRLVRTLVTLGYVRQEPSREYALGPRLIRLGETASKRLGRWARPHLARLVQATGESANLAILEGDQIVYICQVMPQAHSMRMVTEVGRRVDPHPTAVGKAILAKADPAFVTALLERTGMAPCTPRTITTPEAFRAELDATWERGFAVDDEEQELGVRCVAVTVPDTVHRLAISVSGPSTRMADSRLREVVDHLRLCARSVGDELARLPEG